MHLRDWLAGWQQDFHFAARQMRRSPGFFLVAASTLALGIAAATSIFTVVSSVLLRPLPYPHGDRIVQLWEVNARGRHMQFADPNFTDLRSRARSFGVVAQANDAGIVSVSGPAEPVRAHAAMVSRDFFRVMGVSPARGRAFDEDELRENGTRAVLVSDAFWREALSGSPDVLGRTLSAEGQTYTIVGVMPPGFRFPAETELWIARETQAPLPSRSAHNWRVVARLADGVTVEQAHAESHAFARGLQQEYGQDVNLEDVAVVPLRDEIAGGTKSTLELLLAGALLLLVIACANVVNLLVARMSARQGELAVRMALGAGARRLVQQCVAEALMLMAGATALALGLTIWSVKLLLRLEPGTLPRSSDVTLDWRVFAFAIGIAAATALIMGLITAWRATRGVLRESLAQTQRTLGGARSSESLRRALVVGQIAMAVVLLVTTGLFARSFARLLAVDPGFATEGRVVVDVVPGGEPRERARFYDEALARFRTTPGVTVAGGVAVMPLTGASGGDGTFVLMSSLNEPMDFETFGRLMHDKARSGSAEYRVASDGYFEAMHIPLLRGRTFDARDVAGAPHTAVISQSLATARWPDRDPIGQVVEFGNMDGDMTPFTIVGVVGDVRESALAEKPHPTLYSTFRQRPVAAWQFNFVISARDAAGATASARRIVRELRPDVPPRIRSIDAILTGSVADRRFVLSLVSCFGAAALLLAALGVYSVISYLVALRKRELTIRIALGARSQDILRLVLGQGMALSFVGVALGLAAAFAASRLIASMLFGVTPTDPVAFSAVVAVLALVALVASWIPARRAARAEAADAMRAA